MSEAHPGPVYRPGPSTGGTVSGWLVAILLILFLGLYLKMSGLWPAPLLDPNAAPRTVTPRGDLAEDEKSTIELFSAVNQSVVHITTSAVVVQFRMNPQEIPQGSGSGFIWDQNGYVVTNYHVIRDARCSGGKVRVILFNSATYPAEVVGVNPAADLAVLRIKAPPAELKPIPIGKSADLKVGQKVFAIGSPFSLDQSLSTGIVSGLGREINSAVRVPIRDVIQVNAAINPGNSGGPLLDSAGRLIGVTTAIASNTGEFSGIGFAIPVDTVNAVVPELIKNGTTAPPSLGLSFLRDDVTARLLKSGAIKDEGVIVNGMTAGGTAEAAGIQPMREVEYGRLALGDLIVAFDGQPVTEAKTILQLVAAKKVGDVVKLTIVRDGKRIEVPVTLQADPSIDE